MDIGLTIKKLRKQKKISQTAFGKKCGISQTALSQIESKKANPTKKNLQSICKALEINEALLHILSITEEDIPENKKEYKQMFPSVKQLIIKILEP